MPISERFMIKKTRERDVIFDGKNIGTALNGHPEAISTIYVPSDDTARLCNVDRLMSYF